MTMNFDPRRTVTKISYLRDELRDSGAVIPSAPLGRFAASRYHQSSHPSLYTRDAALTDVVNLTAHLCLVNGVTVPAYVNRPLNGVYGTCSRYRGDQYLVAVQLDRCRIPQISGHSWSWPGYKADVTVAGVIAHEMGHLCHWSSRNTFRRWTSDVANEEPVSSYETDSGLVEESVAEAMKLFVLNPTLLAECWPRRYAIIRERYQPVVENHWSEILADSPRHLKAVQNRLAKRRK